MKITTKTMLFSKSEPPQPRCLDMVPSRSELFALLFKSPHWSQSSSDQCLLADIRSSSPLLALTSAVKLTALIEHWVQT